jgi:membrane protein implicated in regulation of membrane protease activity
MLLASTFTFGDALLAVLEFALLFLWIWIAVGVIFDVFRSSDLSNWGKALWLLFILFIPLVGVLVYLIVRGHTMHEHAATDHARAAAFQRYEQTGAASTPADELTKLADLKAKGVLSDDEFESAKAKVLAT